MGCKGVRINACECEEVINGKVSEQVKTTLPEMLKHIERTCPLVFIVCPDCNE